MSEFKPSEFKPDESGAYINPAQLMAAAYRPDVNAEIREILLRASLEIQKERAYIDTLHDQIDHS